MRLFYFLLILFIIPIQVQELTGEQLLAKAIEYHDPNENWKSFIGKLQVTMTTPNNTERVSDIEINIPFQNFKLTTVRDSIETKYCVQEDEITVNKIDWKNTDEKQQITDQDSKRATLMKDYYTYLYGLPMKLNDPDTLITETVEHRVFKGKEYLVLEVMYDENVGNDIWYFYFDPSTYKMEVYQFFKRDQEGNIDKNSGEYIILTGNYQINDINMPKVRQWYYNKDDKFLGADVITN